MTTTNPPEVWLFYPKDCSLGFKNELSTTCLEQGWKLVQRHTTITRLATGRPLRKVCPEDATNLYRRIHRARVGVWQIGDAEVPASPVAKNNPRSYLPLHRFVLNKAFHRKIRTSSFPQKWNDSVADFLSWLQCIGCEGTRDPRCLPFHVFMSRIDPRELEADAGRSQFARAHRLEGGTLRDSRNLDWAFGSPHGHHSLQVAGCDLPTGFHWDVSCTSKGRTWSISNTSEIWRVRRHGYLNVSPDAHIRGGKGAMRTRK